VSGAREFAEFVLAMEYGTQLHAGETGRRLALALILALDEAADAQREIESLHAEAEGLTSLVWEFGRKLGMPADAIEQRVFEAQANPFARTQPVCSCGPDHTKEDVDVPRV
jgi:hypothetical protein